MTRTDNRSGMLMAHQVAGYPTPGLCLEAGKALIEGGAEILEVQLPFSDPSADGTAIQTACSKVLASGYSVAQGLDYVREVHALYPDVPIFVMTYASLAYRPGVAEFVRRTVEAGASGLIIPDLPFDNDEGLGAECGKRGIHKVPVAAPSMSGERLAKLTGSGLEYIYVALRAGITGAKTVITDEMLGFIGKVSSGGAKVLGGFGITSGEQAGQLAPHVHAVVAGSVFVNIITGGYDPADEDASARRISAELREKAAELAGRQRKG